MTAKQNKAGNIPAHNEHSNSNANDAGAKSIYISKIFRSQIKWIGAKTPHESAIDSAKEHKPENK